MLLCLTSNHQNASFDVLEKLSLGAPAAATELVGSDSTVAGAVVLATCNRFEAYLDITASTADAAVDTMLAALSTGSGVSPQALRSSITVLEGDAVANHLFAVTSGLESVVIGEDEISGQVRRALDHARSEGVTTSDLEKLFQKAAHTSKFVRNTTELGGAGRSLVRLALELASSRVTDWSEARVLLVGTGQYAATTLAALRDRGATDIRVFSPSGRASRFATKYGVRAELSLAPAIATSEVVITCTASLAVLPTDIPNDNRRLVIDLGLPRNVDPAVAAMPGVELLDLELIGKHAPVEALTATADARALVGSAAAAFTTAASVEPAIVALRKHIFDLLDAELERSKGSAETEAALRHLAGVFLHGPSVRARDLASKGQAAQFAEGLEALFGVVVQPPVAASDHDVASAS